MLWHEKRSGSRSYECRVTPPALQVFERAVSLPELVYVAVFSLRVIKDTAAP